MATILRVGFLENECLQNLHLKTNCALKKLLIDFFSKMKKEGLKQTLVWQLQSSFSGKRGFKVFLLLLNRLRQKLHPKKYHF